MHTGHKIKQLMIKKKFKQNQMAELLGITTQRMNQILNEEDIGVQRLIQICKYLEVPLNEVIDSTDLFIAKDNDGEYKQLDSLKNELQAQKDLVTTQKKLIAILEKSFPNHNINIKQTGTSD